MSDHEHVPMQGQPYCARCGLLVGEDTEEYQPVVLTRKEANKAMDRLLLSIGYTEIREMGNSSG